MRQTDWLPCECGKCFFCLNGLKNGIGHWQKRTRTIFVQHDNSQTLSKDCTKKRVGLKRGSQYCRMCYRKQCNGTEEERARSSLERETACRWSTMGYRHVTSRFVTSVGQRCTTGTVKNRSISPYIVFPLHQNSSITSPTSI
jgi:hypothetical protein